MNKHESKIKTLGGVQFTEESSKDELGESKIETLEEVKHVMGTLPSDDVIDFITEFGNSRFEKNVAVKSLNTCAFLSSSNIELGDIFGWLDGHSAVLNVIETYYQQDQLNRKFFPLFEGYPGDIIYYSLEKSNLGCIYYWHHESDMDAADTLIAESFEALIETLFVLDDIDEKEQPPLTDDELQTINEKRAKFNMRPIDQYRNEI